MDPGWKVYEKVILGILLIFLHEVTIVYRPKIDLRWFFEENMAKSAQKWAQNGAFQVLWKGNTRNISDYFA